MPSYPENTVWYIEARPWNGSKDGQAGFAQVDPVSRGSGVVVGFIKIDSVGNRVHRSYLLTCAHVVRDAQDCLLEDIICYPPGRGYVRTPRNARRCGTFPNAEARPAKVSKCSPCKGELGPRSDNLRNDVASDWVLLEIADTSFDRQPAVLMLAEDGKSIEGALTVIGYPYGAGTIAERQFAEARGNAHDYPFWDDGRLVLPTSTKEFRAIETAKPGILDYQGSGDTESGMSGGGIFETNKALVAIHRSSTDVIMTRSGLRTDTIAKYLRAVHELEFASGPQKKEKPPPPPWTRIIKIAIAVLAMTASLLKLYNCKHSGRHYYWRGQVVELVNQDGETIEVPVDGAKVTPMRNNVTMVPELSVSSGSVGPGKFEIRTDNKEDASSQNAKLRIEKDGYFTIERDAQAHQAERDSRYFRTYTLRRENKQ